MLGDPPLLYRTGSGVIKTWRMDAVGEVPSPFTWPWGLAGNLTKADGKRYVEAITRRIINLAFRDNEPRRPPFYLNPSNTTEKRFRDCLKKEQTKPSPSFSKQNSPTIAALLRCHFRLMKRAQHQSNKLLDAPFRIFERFGYKFWWILWLKKEKERKNKKANQTQFNGSDRNCVTRKRANATFSAAFYGVGEEDKFARTRT